MGHAWAGPEGCFVAQRLGSAKQQLFKAIPVACAQPWLPPGPAGLLQSRRAGLPILSRPACNGLPDYLDAARHLGLIQALIHEAHRGIPPLLKCLEITLDPGGIAHA